MTIEAAVRKAVLHGFTTRDSILGFVWAFLYGRHDRKPRIQSIKARYRRMHHEAFLRDIRGR